MKFEYTRDGQLVVLEVEVVRNAETGIVEGVIAAELVAAACEMSMEQAGAALSAVFKTHKHLKEVYFKQLYFSIE